MNNPISGDRKKERRTLYVNEWPEADRLAWQSACRPSHRLKKGGAASQLAPVSQEEIARRFARPAQDKFAGLDWRVGIFGAPLLDRCIAHIECTFEHSLASGDHDIIIGRVHRVRVYAGEPLIFHRSQFGTVVSHSATG